MKTLKIVIVLMLMPFSLIRASEYNGRYGWSTQKAPKKIILCEPGTDTAQGMLLESLSGLAAQAVNEGKSNEMVWININQNASYNKIYTNTLAALQVPQPKEMSLWALVDYLKGQKIIKGYVLYKMDTPRSNAYASHPNTNYSSNVATVYSSLLKGVLIDESLEKEAQRHGLKLLKDARNESLETCFKLNKKKLNNCSALSIPPTVTNLRDYAIAHKLMLYADQKAIIDEVLEWVKPLSPILGWGCGDEYDFTSLISQWGHVNTATNWCWNLPLISSLGENIELKKSNEISPKEINFNDTISFHSFVMSDGDNMQWTMGAFIDEPAYMGHKECTTNSLNWTLCPTELSVVSPFTWNAIAGMQHKSFSLLEYGGGYQYPDLFAINRPNRTELLREFAQRLNVHLRKLDIKIFGFICWNVASEAAQEAFQIYAEELDGITGMMAVQYFPYELEGEIYWKTNKKGIDIPIVASRYSIWDEVNALRPRAGTPEFISSLINREVTTSHSKGENRLDWTIVHAWSDFGKSSNLVEFPSIGFNPVKVAENLLIDNVKTVSANELLWRIRMKYRKEQTKLIIEREIF